MNRFSDELRIISPVALAIALLAGGGLGFLLMFVAIQGDHQMSHWPLIAQICFSGGLGLVLTAVVLLIGYINADAKRRGMRYVMWTLLAIFLPNSLGIILYFVLRDPLPVRCRKCDAPVQPTFTFCPQCGAELSGACPACKRGIDPGWKRCAFCGGALAS